MKLAISMLSLVAVTVTQATLPIMGRRPAQFGEQLKRAPADCPNPPLDRQQEQRQLEWISVVEPPRGPDDRRRGAGFVQVPDLAKFGINAAAFEPGYGRQYDGWASEEQKKHCTAEVERRRRIQSAVDEGTAPKFLREEWMGYDPEELTARGATKFSETGGRHTKPLPYLDVAGNQLAVVTAEKKRQAAAAERDRLEMECTEMLKRLKTQHAANEALRKTNELTRRYIQALRAIVCMPQMGGNDKPGQRNALPE